MTARILTLLCVASLLGCAIENEEGDGGPLEGSDERDASLTDSRMAVDDGGMGDAGQITDAEASVDGGTVDAGVGLDAGPFTPNPRLAELASNHAMALGDYECVQEPGDAPCKRVTEFSGFVYDAGRHQLLMFGGGHATTFTDSVYRFDLDSLRWEAIYPQTPCSSLVLSNLDRERGVWLDGPAGPYPRPVSRHTYDELAVVNGEFIVLASPNGRGGCAPEEPDMSDPFFMRGRVAHFDLATKTWSFSPTAEGDVGPRGALYPGTDYDPVSGNIVSVSRDLVQWYDPRTRVSTPVVWGNGGGDAAFPMRAEMGIEGSLVYYPPTDRFYFFGKNRSERVRVWELTLDRDTPSASRLQLLETTGPASPRRRGYALDTRNNVIGGGSSDGMFYIFHPEERRWEEMEIQGETPKTVSFHALAYDPVNNVFFFLDVDHKMWAYRYR